MKRKRDANALLLLKYSQFNPIFIQPHETLNCEIMRLEKALRTSIIGFYFHAIPVHIQKINW